MSNKENLKRTTLSNISFPSLSSSALNFSLFYVLERAERGILFFFPFLSPPWPSADLQHNAMYVLTRRLSKVVLYTFYI